MFSFKRLKKIRVKCWPEDVEMWLDLVLAYSTIEELEINIKGPWRLMKPYFDELHPKLNQVSRNIKLVTLRFFVTHLRRDRPRNVIEKNEFVHFLEASQWFSKLSVAFENDNGSLCEIIPEVEEFFKDVSQIKNYNVKKSSKYRKAQIDFERCA